MAWFNGLFLMHIELLILLRKTEVKNIKQFLFKDVQGWQFLTMKAAETLCIV